MKSVILVLVGVLLMMTLCLVAENASRWVHPEKRYCGKVVEKFRTDAGHKSQPQAHVVFYCNSLGRNIDIEVTWNCYANCKIGQYVCFDLAESSLKK